MGTQRRISHQPLIVTHLISAFPRKPVWKTERSCYKPSIPNRMSEDEACSWDRSGPRRVNTESIPLGKNLCGTELSCCLADGAETRRLPQPAALRRLRSGLAPCGPWRRPGARPRPPATAHPRPLLKAAGQWGPSLRGSPRRQESEQTRI